MKATVVKIICLFLLVSACSKNDDTPAPIPVAVDDDLAGPISRPSSGYGADGKYGVSQINFDNPEYAGTKVTIFYPTGITTAKPTIFYSHPYGGESADYNIGLF